MKSYLKRNVSGSGKVDVLSDLQKQKEIILRDIEEQRRKKQREQEQKQVKVTPTSIVINERNVKEKTPPVNKKCIRIEPKSFAEIMREAEQRSKQKPDISEMPISKKKVNEINGSSLSSISIKRKLTNEVKTDQQSAIPNKKLKLKDNENNHSEKSKPKVPLPINSIGKQNSALSVKSSMYNHNTTNSTKLNSNPKIVDRLPIKNINTVSQGSSKFTKCGIMAQSSIRNTDLVQKQPSKYSNNNHSKSSISTQNPSKNLVTNKSLQNSDTKISSVSGKQNKTNGVLSSQRSQPMNNYQNDNNYSRSIPNMNSQNKKISKTFPPSSINRGICAQNGDKSNRNYQNDSQKIAYSSGLPIRGIFAQNGANSNINYQNNSQKNTYSGPPVRGIAAQSAVRGILAQSGNKFPGGDSYISESDYDDEYDSDLDNFIDDTEVMVDESIKKEIYKSLNYDPNKYAKVSRYDDCKNMVSHFDDICKEEIRSSKIGRQEDTLELKELERANEKKMKMKSKYY